MRYWTRSRRCWRDPREAYAEIIGYTDRYGPVAYNLALSRQRAQSVANRLFQRGIAEDRLRIEGQGPIDHRADAGIEPG
jgi:outer membrane protein OmpA-like peptidoglycan-associated protein